MVCPANLEELLPALNSTKGMLRWNGSFLVLLKILPSGGPQELSYVGMAPSSSKFEDVLSGGSRCVGMVPSCSNWFSSGDPMLLDNLYVYVHT